MTTFNIYRRESSDINPPVAIATGLTSMFYSDATASEGKTYLYSVGAIKNGFEKISSEVLVKTSNSIITIQISDGKVGDVDGVYWTIGGGVVQDGKYYSQRSSGISRIVDKVIAGDFYVRLGIQPQFSTWDSGYITMFDFSNINIRFGDQGFGNKLQFSLNAGVVASIYSTAIRKDEMINNPIYYVIEFQRKNGVCSAYCNEALLSLGTGVNPSSYPIQSFTDNRVINSGGNATAAATQNWQGYIDYLELSETAKY